MAISQPHLAVCPLIRVMKESGLGIKQSNPLFFDQLHYFASRLHCCANVNLLAGAISRSDVLKHAQCCNLT